jgi:polyhydroxyalkanoate synthesis regulator phasin
MDTPESPREKRPLAETFERLWGQALLAVSTAEEEAGRVVQRVTAAAGWSQDEVRRHARELTERLVTQRQHLERNVEDGVRKALGRMTLPRREELQDVSARLDRIAERIRALEEPR